mgnify:CR=1 FL=1|jgi:hypothetical protein
MKICFTGDVFLGGDLNHKSCRNVVEVEAFKKADIRIINLEQPISDNNFVENKSTLYTDSFALNQLKDLKVTAVNLANNHIQDKGLVAIDETTRHLQSKNIGFFGGGKNIFHAEKPYWLTDEIALLGYCEFEKPYLSRIVVATDKSAGVNPLRLEKIKSDLDNLPNGKKAILYFHWGMEHIWLPPPNDILLAKKLLEDDRIISIFGMQAHRAQGIINHAGKKAYMCLGNFIFPNFYIKPPVQIFYPKDEDKKKISFITRHYLSVHKMTYKKWRWINRISMMIEFCTKTNQIKHKFVIQDDNIPKISELSGFGLAFYKIWIPFISIVYKLPKTFYLILYKLQVFQVTLIESVYRRYFELIQLGFLSLIYKTIKYVKKKNR